MDPRAHELKRRYMGRAIYWRCNCGYETADLTKVASHAVAKQFEVPPK